MTPRGYGSNAEFESRTNIRHETHITGTSGVKDGRGRTGKMMMMKAWDDEEEKEGIDKARGKGT